MKKTLLAVSLSLLSGCSTLNSLNPFSASTSQTATEPDLAAKQASDQNVVVAERPSSVSENGGTKRIPGIEILWEVPRKPVEVYHLAYGLTESELDREVTIPIEKLEKLDHPAFGPVFRYRLRDVRANQDVFVSMRAENRLGISEPSKVVRISSQSPTTIR